MSEPSESRLDSTLRALFWASLLFVAFIAGALSILVDRFPGPQIANAYEGGKAIVDKIHTRQDVYRTDLWQPERRPEQGVVKNDPRAEQGVTLYTSGNAPAAYLIDMNGNVLHEWQKPFSAVWNPEAPEAAAKTPQPDAFVYFRKARILPDGGLLALYEAGGDTPYGYGMVKLDKDSNIIWSYLGAAHHDFDVGPDGRIYLLTHQIMNDQVDFGNMATPRLEDFLVILAPDGKEQAKIRLSVLFADSEWRHMLYTISSYARVEPLHANAVKVITPEQAANFPFGKPGELLMSFRELGAVAVVDPETEKVMWATKGPWIGQHDPDLLPNGDIMLFDNYGNYSDVTGISRVIQFNPRTMEITWQYTGTKEEPLRSEIRSWEQRLSNGNTFIVESSGGRFFEVTPAGDIVWEFINPVRHTPGWSDKPMIPIIGWAERLDPGTLDPSLLHPQIRGS